MTQQTITRILDLHSIPYQIHSGRIYADSMLSGTALFEILEDVTGWTRSQLYSWLGY